MTTQQPIPSATVDDFFRNRRTIRRFDPSREISPEIIRNIIDLARQAPNTGNMQLYSVVATTDPEALATLAREGHFGQPAATGARAILTFCIDIRRFSRWCRLSGTEPGLLNLQGFVWSATDTAILAQQAVTIAEVIGLGTCYLGTTTYTADVIARLLNLPEGVLPLTSVALGWPMADDSDIKEPRLPLEAILHDETFADPADATIAEYYRPTEDTPAARRFVDENNLPNLAHVFTQVRYPEAQARAFSELYLREIRRAGFEI